MRLAAMGGAYGNLAALAACLDDAAACGADLRAFLGDSIGCCGHSDEVVAMIRERFDITVAGNHEHQAVARAETCGCGYSSPDDEAVSCEAFQLATAALGDAARDHLATWPAHHIVELAGGRVLLCHGSPGYTSEFLFEAELDDLRLEAWLDAFDVRGFICTHSGLPFVRRLRGGRFAVNCGAIGKADHDGDPAVHYALVELGDEPRLEIRRVPYDHEAWARRMEAAGIAPVFVEPIRTGVWTTGVASLPIAERHRWLRGGPRRETSWKPELLDVDHWRATLDLLAAHGLVSASELAEVRALLDPAFPWFAAVRRADSVHLHIKVADVDALPDLGGTIDNERPGYKKLRFAGGLNAIFSSIPIADEDLPTTLPDLRPARPFLDHIGVDLRRDVGVVRAAFDDAPELARRAGWFLKSQGGAGRAVFCCHAQVARKHWLYPPEATRWTRPIELAFGPLVIGTEMTGCDLRPIDPKHPAAAELAACTPPTH